ncbi:MAG: Mn-dependent transcriptional regulator [Oscillospiraceae bacterium]|nr:Mn-dependent transcriptional regulator [Oscillospiraceae bacterium]
MEQYSQFHTVRGYQQLERQDKSLTPAMEDYLEMIYRRSLTGGFLRVNTLSELLNVTAPSATKMVQNLSKLGLVDYRRYDLISLTEQGREMGAYLLARHNMIEDFLKNLGVSEEVLSDTELIEHDISAVTLQKFALLNRFLEVHPDILEQYHAFAAEPDNASRPCSSP